jgi:CRP-like cAMP-binding protein/predicted GNAT family N-acyltransferase
VLLCAPIEIPCEGYRVFKTFIADSDNVREALYRFRYEVFTEEQQMCRNIADHERRVLIDPLDEHAVHLCLEHDGELVGSMRSLQGLDHVPSSWRVNLFLDKFAQFPSSYFTFSGRLLIMPAHRGGRGLLNLIRYAFSWGRSVGARFDFIFCNPHLVRFYELMGWRRYCAYFEDAGLGFQVPLVLVVDDIPHLNAIRSPFAAIAPTYPTDSFHSKWFVDTFPEYQHFVSRVTIGNEAFSKLLARKINDESIDLFDGFESHEIDLFLAMASHLDMPAQTQIVRQGQLGEELYLVLNGVAEVRRRAENGQVRVLGTLGRGDVFGEMSVITARPRSADVVAHSAFEIAFIDRSSLKKLMKGEPMIASKLLFNRCRLMSERTLEREEHWDETSTHTSA